MPTLGIEVIESRGFSDDNPSDQRRAIVVNEALVDYFGWENPIRKRLPGQKFEGWEFDYLVKDIQK